MHPARSEHLRAIFDEAAERPEAERAGFVHAASAGDTALEREVLALLRALEHDSKPLDADASTWLVAAVGAEPRTTPPGSPDDPNAPPLGPDLNGTIVGDFRLLRLIGRGAMGSVYQAEQISLSRPVAVKLLQSWTASREARRRFVDEASILARLRHPGIAAVISAGSRRLELAGPDQSLAEGLYGDLHSVPWIAMELVEDARTIVEFCRQGPMPPESVLRLFATVADAVHHGHQQGIIHRDLKPANILVSASGEPKVIDFGIARAIGANNNPGTAATKAHTLVLTQAGGFLGSLHAMSPEQCDGRAAPVDTRSDVYSLAVVLYEALTGTLPYPIDESSFAAAARTVCETPPEDPRSLAPAIPADAAIVLLKALRKDPAERYQSAAEFAADLRRVCNREPILARPRSVPYKLFMFARRRPALTALAGGAILGLFAGIVGISIGLARERAARAEADRIAWLANLTAADSSIRLGDGGAAMRRLDALPQQRRGWEWRYLHALADTSVRKWQVTDKDAATYLSPSGRSAICHYDDHGDVHADILDPATHQIIARVEDALPAQATIWNPDESLLVILQRQAVVLIDARTGAEVRRWPQKPDRFPLGAAFSPDSALLAVGLSEHAGVDVYNVRTGATEFSKASDAWVYAPAFSPDGGTLAWSDGQIVQSVETATWKPIRSVPTARLNQFEPSNLCYCPRGKLLAVICGLVGEVIDVETFTVRATLRGHAQRVHSISFDDSGDRIVTTSIDRTVRIWNAHTGDLITTLLGHESPTVQARFIGAALPGEPDVVSVDGANRVRTWNLNANGPVLSARANDGTAFVTQLDFASDGSTLRAVGQDSIIIADLRDKPRIASITAMPVEFLSVIPGKELALRNSGRRELSLESLADHSRVWSLDNERVLEFVISPDGLLAAVLRDGLRLSIIRIADGAELGRTQPADPAGYHRPAFAPDGTTLATLSRSGVLRLWNATNGACIAELAGADDRGDGLCWSSDGSILAYSHARQGVTVLDTRTRKPITTIEGVGGYVWSIAISPDKTRMAVGAQDRITHIYQLPSGDELLQLRDHTGTVMAVAWSPDGRFLATGGYDKRVFVYDSTPYLKAAPEPNN